MTISKLFSDAELAQAAYAELDNSKLTNHPNNIAALTDPDGGGMSQRQAEEFAARYPTVVTQFNDTGTSFSATVFADESGNLTVAFRGTDELGDITPTDGQQR